LEKPKIAHEIYRKRKKGLHASAYVVRGGMHFSTKKIDHFFAIEAKKINKIIKNLRFFSKFVIFCQNLRFFTNFYEKNDFF
jgi:hypothetical protein